MNQKLIITTLLACSLQSALAEQVLRRGGGAEPESLDPQLATGVPEADILRDLFEGLVANDANGDVTEGVAESWSISEDGKVYTFKLRPTTWSDGTPVTAHDFVFGWQRAVNPEIASQNSNLLYPIKNAKAITLGQEKDVSALGVKAIDDLTLEVTLENPTPYFLAVTMHNAYLPAPRHAIEKHGKEWTRKENIVSNGPFKMTDWVPNSQITTVKADYYWDKDNVKLDKVIFFNSEDMNSELKRYRAGELDLTRYIPIDQMDWILKNIGDEYKATASGDLYYYGYNSAHPPFKDNPKLRQALSLAIDRDIIVEKIIGTGQKGTFSILPANLPGYTPYVPEYAGISQAERIERAKALYAEAGYSKDKPLKITMLYNTSENHKKIAIAMAAMWKQHLGVEASLDNKEWKVYLQERRQKSPSMHLFRAGWTLKYLDPNSILERFQSDTEVNDVSFNSPEFDKLMQASSVEADAQKRFELLRQAEKVLIDEQGVIPIYHYINSALVKPYVKGFNINVSGRNRSKYLSIEK